MPTNFPTQHQMNEFLHFLRVSISMIPRIAIGALIVLLLLVLLKGLTILTLRLADMRRLLARDKIFLELTPHAYSSKTPHANQQFFADLHGFETIRSVAGKLLMHKLAFTAEMVGTRERGIRYIFCVPKKHRDSFIKDVASFDTTIRVEQVKDYLTKAQRLRVQLLEFRLKDPYHPLQKHDSYVQSDPVGYLLGAMANLKAGELMAIQLVLSPTRAKHVDKIRARVMNNAEHMNRLGGRSGGSVGITMARGLSSALFAVTDVVGEVHHGSSSYSRQSQRNMAHHYREVGAGIKPARDISSIEQAVAEKANDKFDEPLYRTNIRALVVADNAQDRANDIRKSFNVYRTSYQAIKSRLNFPYGLRGKYRAYMFEHRLPGILDKTSCLLSASEVASIYHFPDNSSNRNGEVVTSLSKTLPAPVGIRNRSDNHEFDVIFGHNEHLGTSTDIGLVAKEREKHMYIIGSTGNGKTTLMLYAIIQDIWSGKGVAVIDPHGDLAKTILKYIPKERVKDVVYLNPRDIKRPIGLNLLELPAGLDEDDLLLEKGRVATAVISVMRKVFSDDESNAHRIEAVMRNAILTAFTVEGATLFTVLKLFRNGKFRKEVVSKLEDGDLKDFWQEEIGQAGEMQLVSMTKGVTQRIDRFNSSEPVKRMIGQAKSTIDFEDIMNSGKILICNLAHGKLEEDESSLLGTTVLAKLKMAAERRIDMPENERRPFYVYVDEFQNFATTPFVKMLSSSRKYKLFLTIAEQSTKQQDEDRLTEAILSNVSTVVCFRTGSHADEELMLHKFDPYLTRGDISNLPAYNFYIRIQAQISFEPMSGVTIVLPEGDADEAIAAKVIKKSRETYGVEYIKPVDISEPPESGDNQANEDTGNRKSEGNSTNENDALNNNDDT